MDSLDLNTQLPPRKRLLAGLKRDSSDCNLSLPIPSISSELYDRLHRIIKSTSSSPQEIIEEVNSVASDAAKAAVAARGKAMEKAAMAAEAKVAAKNALELLDLITGSDSQSLGSPTKKRLRMRCVEVKHLYENGEFVETDEEIARKLHRVMNSSPRISVSSGSCRKLKSRGDSLERRKEFDQGRDKQHDGSKVVVGKKAKVKRKKLLSQFNVRARGKPEKLLVSVDSALTGAPGLNNEKPLS